MNNAAVTPISVPTNPTMKLLIDSASRRVLFAEAGKDVVDFLFGVLAMPVGALANLLLADGDALGSIGNVYASVEKMDDAYMQDRTARDALLVNTSLPSGPSVRLLPSFHCDSYSSIPAYDNWPGYIEFHPMAQPYPTMPPPPSLPTNIGIRMYPPPTRTSINLQPPEALSGNAGSTGWPLPQLYRCHSCHALGALQGCGGFVQGVATYTVMDDLAVAPTTSISTIALLNKLGVKDIDALEERTVSVGRQECLEILKASLRSKAVLTSVFLATKKRPRTYEEEVVKLVSSYFE